MGGITGRVYLSTQYKVENCYNVGKVIENVSDEEKTIYVGNIVGEHESGIIENCYYEKSEIYGIGAHVEENCIDDIIEVETSYIKTKEIIEKLNRQETIYYYDKQNINNGYPILEWQYIDLTVQQIQPKTKIHDLKLQIGKNAQEIKVYNNDKEILNENNFVGTGMQIELVQDDIKRRFTLIVKGDVTGEGQTDIKDIVKINRHRLHKITLEEENIIAGDVTGEGQVDIKDIVKINRFRLHKIAEM